MKKFLPEYSDIVRAAKQLKGNAVRTPLLRSDVLDDQVKGRVFIKAECLQRTGSFKFRGAFNRISRLSDAEKQIGVLAYSSGNHAQGIAASAKLLGTHAKILMPKDAPNSKVEGVRFWGGEVVFFDRTTESREDMAHEISTREGRVLVPPYEDPWIIAGQGTAGLEAVEQMAEQGATPDIAICPAGGGGLVAGVGMAIKHQFPKAQIWAAEPEGFDDHVRSLASGQREVNDRLTGSICDAVITPTPGELTWQINQYQLSGGLTVSDEEALDAMAFAWRHFKIVIEPGAVIALASVLSGKIDVSGQSVCVLATGGNVDPDMFSRALARV